MVKVGRALKCEEFQLGQKLTSLCSARVETLTYHTDTLTASLCQLEYSIIYRYIYLKTHFIPFLISS